MYVAIWNEIYTKILKRYEDRIHLMRYEDLKVQFEPVVTNLLEVAGLDDQGDLRSTWAPNTSFEGDVPDVARKFRFAVSTVGWVFRFVPSAVCESVARNRVKKLNKPLPHWFFRVFSGGDEGQSE
jgi:hypothetical protein